MVMAILKGLSKGLIVAVFSIIGYILGLAAALKFSSSVALYFEGNEHVSGRWLPFLSFALVFIGVVLLVRLGAAFIEKAFQITMLGWLNRLGGIVFFVALYTIVFSIFIFYAVEMHLVKADTLTASGSYAYIRPWGPMVIDNLGNIIPIFRNMFNELQHFFEASPGQMV